MRNDHNSKTLLVSLLAILVCFVSSRTMAAEGGQEELVSMKISIMLSDRLADPLPPDIRDMVLPIADPKKICEGLIILPDIQLVRADRTDQTGIALLPKYEPCKNPRVIDWPACFAGKKPSREKVEADRREALQSVRAGKELTQPGQKTVTLEELANDSTVKDANLRFVLLKSDEAHEAEIKKVLSAGNEPIVVKDKNTLYQRLLENLCTGDPAQVKQTASDKNIVVIYKPPPPELPPPPPENGGTTVKPRPRVLVSCNPDILSRGMQFVSLAKNANHPKARTEDLENALHLFDKAVSEAKAAGKCCAKAFMNRGVVLGLLEQPNMALDDLLEAERCDPQDVEVLYNLACRYSLNRQLDYARNALGKALAAGFKDCKLLREDRDLANLRANRNLFRDKLEEYGLYCK